LEEDNPNDYTIFDMITGQYDNHDFTTGCAQTMSPTPVPVSIAEPSSHESNEITDTLKPPKTNTTALPVANPPIRTSNRSNKGKKPEQYGNDVIQMPKKRTRVIGGDGVIKEDKYTIIGVALPEINNCHKAWEISVPTTYKAAMNTPQADEWREACEKQLSKIAEKEGYTLEDISENDADTDILPGKWVFDLKCDEDGWILEYRARWVICGNFERPGINDGDKYAPVATDTSLKLFFTKIAYLGLKWRQVDLVTAYLNALINDKKIYMR
jgi:hypothetical protein